MTLKNFASVAVLALFAMPLASAQTDYKSDVWVADLGNGSYKNPILYADYSDPDICRVGDDFYMTASSFNCIPGLPILHSKDLVNWSIIGYALERQVPEEMFCVPSHGNGVWAPSIRFHNGEFFIYWGDPDNGIYMVKTKNPAGRWESPVLVHKSKGIIDTCPLWDEDGRAWIGHGYAGSRAGLKSILGLIEMTPDGTKTIGEDRMIYDGHLDNVTIEGVKLYKRDGFYYILCPAGGVPTGYQLAMRSRDIAGPYDWKIVMAQGKSKINGPHQGGLVDTPDGKEEWFVHFQDLEAYGRVAHLNPVNWVDGWPVMGVDKDGDLCGEPVEKYKKPNLPQQPIHTPVESDLFDSNSLGLQWQWHANANALWSFADQKQGVLRLFSWPVENAKYNNMWDVPNLLLQKFPAPNFTATTKVKFHPSDKHTGERCGLVVMGWDYAGLVMTNTPDGIELSRVNCKQARKGKAEQTEGNSVKIAADQYVYLRVKVSFKQGEKAEAHCTFSYSLDGKKFLPLGSEFEATPGQWIGAKVGLFCTRDKKGSNDGGWMDADDFIISK